MVNQSYNFWNGRKVLVTGHTGFKGSWLTMFLRMYGADVSGYSLKPSQEHILWPIFEKSLGVKSFFGNICDFADLSRSVDEIEPEIVFHLAAQPIVSEAFFSPLETIKTNVLGTSNILEIFNRNNAVKSLVVVTSDKVYAHPLKNTKGFNEDSPLGGSEIYSASKASSEILVASYRSAFESNISSKSRGIATARAGNVLGGGDWGQNRLLPDIFRARHTKTPLILWNPMSIRPWQNVFDLCQGYLDLGLRLHLEPSKYSSAWNFSNNNTSARVIDVIDTANKIFQSLGQELIQTSVSNNTRDFKEELELKIDSSKSERLLDWRPRRDFTTTVSDTVNWYVKNMGNTTIDGMFQYSSQECLKYIVELND